MAKISELSDGGSLQSTDFLIAVRSGGNVKVQADGNLSLGTVTADGLTVDTDTLVVDATNNRVGIGTSSPTSPNGFTTTLEVAGSSASLVLTDNSGAGASSFEIASSSGSFRINDETDERFRIDSSGNVIVNDAATSAPGFGVAAGKNISFSENSTSLSYANIFRQSSSASLILANGYLYTGTANGLASSISTSWAKSAIAVGSGDIRFYTDPAATVAKDTDVTPTEAMRIDSSGNLLVGMSTASTTVDGLYLRPGTNSGINASSSHALTLNRRTNDGDILKFTKDGATVGSIGTKLSDQGTSDGELYISSGNTGLFFDDQLNYIRPANGSGALRDNIVDLGEPDSRFKDLYLSGKVHLQYPGNSYYGRVEIDSSTNLIFGAGPNGLEGFRLDSDGNLLVGVTTLADVNNLVTNHLFEGANSSAGSGAVGVYNNTGTANCPALLVLNRDASTDSSNRFVQFYADVTSSSSTAMGGIVGNGASNVQFAALSDAREKTNIESISGSLIKINALNPVEFDWIASGEHVNAGFVAQEVEQVFPEFVVENMAEEGSEERKGLTGGMTGGIVAHLVKAIQEQNELINDLRARVAQLEGAN